MAGESGVRANRRVDLIDVHVLPLSVRDENRSRPEQERRAPAIEQGNVGRERKDRRWDSGDRVKAHHRDSQDFRDGDVRLDLPRPREHPSADPTIRNISSADADGEITLGAIPPSINPME